MAYTTANLNVIVAGQGGAPTLWSYVSADAHLTVSGAGYFTDGANKGLKANDIVFVLGTAAATGTMHGVLNATTVNAATLA